jgi:hypothetical protein
MTTSPPNVLRNFTLHPQTPRELELARSAGFHLTPKPEGIEIPAGTPLAAAALEFANRLRDAARQGHAVLVGGHTALWIAAILSLPPADLPRMFYFETARTRDEQGRFVFTPLRLCEISR